MHVSAIRCQWEPVALTLPKANSAPSNNKMTPRNMKNMPNATRAMPISARKDLGQC